MNIHPAFLINVKNLNLKNYFILYHLQPLSLAQVSIQLTIEVLNPETVQTPRVISPSLTMRNRHHYQSGFL